MRIPQVYISAETLQNVYRLYLANHKSQFRGIAFNIDDGDVFHVYVENEEASSDFLNITPIGCYKGLATRTLIEFLQDVPESDDLAQKFNSLEVDNLYLPPLWNNSLLVIWLHVSEESIESWVYYVDFKNNTLVKGDLMLIPGKSELYSRNHGLLELSLLETKKVGIVGLGSGGSTIAVELAKAGVGNFVLIDFDRLQLSNVARHVCGIDDVGRYKTKAVRDAILCKNPYAIIQSAEVDIVREEQVAEELLSSCDLLIAATDNNPSRYAINEISIKYNIVSLFPRAYTRAMGGDILRARPKQGPCLACFQPKSEEEEISSFSQARQIFPAYTPANDIMATIQVGLSSDIAPISNMVVKLALVELSRGLESGIASLERDLVADYYLWINRRDDRFSNLKPMEFSADKVSILRWYGARLARKEECLVCGNKQG